MSERQKNEELSQPAPPDRLHYFVDDAGDPVLFDTKGRIIVGNEGCSKYFILGKLEIADPAGLSQRLETLRTRLLSDPYFKGVPSMQPAQQKTAVAFHAKDDLAEVRREVFSQLLLEEVRFYAVVRDKRELVSFVQQKNRENAEYRYSQNRLYDEMATGLFSRLHGIAEHFQICFAQRGNKDRTKALREAIRNANKLFESSFGFMNGECQVSSGTPVTHAGLQAVDYFLWALQRFYEKQEDRYVQLIWPKVGEIHDLDFVEGGRRGVSYTNNTPLTWEGRIKKSGI